MAEKISGLSTLGVTFGYGIETTIGTTPAAFTQLNRINALSDLGIEVENIDSSALEDYISKFVAGRGSVSDTFTITVNLTDETATEWETLLAAAATAKESNLSVWFETIIPGLTKAFFVVAEPPTKLPQPALDQNGLLTMEVNCTVKNYVGMSTKVAFTV